MDHFIEIARYRHQAEELRGRAALPADPQTRAQYLKMAEAYEALANGEEQVPAAGNDQPASGN